MPSGSSSRGAELKADPARLADEAASISMFGGARWILVEPAGDESVPALEALLDAPAAGNPVAVLAGALKPASKLLKLALGAADALAFASYVPDAREADRLVAELARAIGPGGARRRRPADRRGVPAAIARSSSRSSPNIALYLDASPDAPKPLDHESVDALGAAAEERGSRAGSSRAWRAAIRPASRPSWRGSGPRAWRASR